MKLCAAVCVACGNAHLCKKVLHKAAILVKTFQDTESVHPQQALTEQQNS
jgi:hypothetical protein